MAVLRDHRTVSIADQIFEQLEKDILSGRHARGEIISKAKLSAELGVSRTPVREAITRLVQEHILIESGRGLEVVGISREDMLDMYEIRIQLEGACAARAARNVSDAQLKEMEEVLELQRYYIGKAGAPGAFSDDIKDLDSRFHGLLVFPDKDHHDRHRRQRAELDREEDAGPSVHPEQVHEIHVRVVA